jgi:galactose oxidase
MATQIPFIVCSFLFSFPPGGGLCAGCNVNHQDFEILIPPYLFNADGTLATTTRPIIQSVTPHNSVVQAGGNVVVQMNSSGPHTFALIRHSAVTHATNNDQRRIPLSVTSQSGSTFTLKIPDSVNVALTGVYFLFAMNGSGIPSVASVMTISL